MYCQGFELASLEKYKYWLKNALLNYKEYFNDLFGFKTFSVIPFTSSILTYFLYMHSIELQSFCKIVLPMFRSPNVLECKAVFFSCVLLYIS